MKQCTSCGGDCGRTAGGFCRYGTYELHKLITKKELEDIKKILSGHILTAEEAAIECYLLGVNRRIVVIGRDDE